VVTLAIWGEVSQSTNGRPPSLHAYVNVLGGWQKALKYCRWHQKWPHAPACMAKTYLLWIESKDHH